jgi:predicted GNAT family acetyltransferase
MQVDVRHDAVAHRFEATIDGHLSVADYRLASGGNVVTFFHTEVPSQQRGRGIAAALVGAALQWARAQQLKVVPACSYVARYMQRHPETQDLLR